MSNFVPCPACNRHVLSAETACPFCTAALPESLRLQTPAPRPPGRLSRAALLAAGAALMGAEACSPHPGLRRSAGFGHGSNTRRPTAAAAPTAPTARRTAARWRSTARPRPRSKLRPTTSPRRSSYSSRAAAAARLSRTASAASKRPADGEPGRDHPAAQPGGLGRAQAALGVLDHQAALGEPRRSRSTARR